MGYCLFPILLLFVVASSTHICSIKEGIEGYTCVCEEALNGWTYTCFDANFSYPIIITLKVNISLTLECGNYDPHYKSIFRQVVFDRFKHVIFNSCSFPNTSFSEIINYRQNFAVEQITIERKRGNKSLTPELFGNFASYLTELNLRNNGIHSIPGSMFVSFSVLRVLSLSNNKLSILPEGIFANLGKLVNLDIANNVLESLPERIFEHLHNLEELNLHKNKLKELPSNIFKSLLNLQVLDISNNNLTVLADDIIHGLTQLVSVQLNANSLIEISKDLFNTTFDLKNVNMGLNKFIEPLPIELFFGLSKLEKIMISDCNLSKIPENFFSQCPNLAFLNLERNKLVRLPDNVFQNNPELNQVNLNFNDLKELSSNLFPNQKHLEVFNVFRNKITKIPDGLFKRARNVKILQLSENYIQNASQTMFRDLPNLEELRLNKNILTHFQLYNNEQIKIIDLSFNNLSAMPYIKWSRHTKLEEFNLSHNKLNSLTIPSVKPINRSPILNFSNNKIQKISASVSVYEKKRRKLEKDYLSYVMTRVDLTNNPFICECNIYKFVDYYRNASGRQEKKYFHLLSVDKLVCSSPQNLAGKSMMSLSPSQFTCELLKQCPLSCYCYRRAEDNAIIGNCSYLHFKNIPTRVPNNTNILYLNNNMLQSVADLDLSMWENLTELYLDNNIITRLENLKVPSNLSKLSLESNQITHLPSSLMEYISGSSHFEITLSKNPWTCNCLTLRFKKWLTHNYMFVKDVREVICANRLKVNGTFVHLSIITTPDDILCPIDDLSNKFHLITVTIICVILALLFIVSVLYYHNKEVVIAYVYIHMHNVFNCFCSEEDKDKDKVFDAFISCSSSDREVAFRIVKELEEDAKRFKLCIAERDFIPGHAIICNILHAVYSSKRTILVVSKAFLKSKWFRVEFRTAYCQMLEDKIDRLIIIVKGELPPKETMDKDLQYLLSTKTYLVWEEKWFWEKLKYAMPHKRRQVLPNDVLALKDRPASEKIRAVNNQILVLSSGVYKTTDKVHKVIQNHTNAVIAIGRKDALIGK